MCSVQNGGNEGGYEDLMSILITVSSAYNSGKFSGMMIKGWKKLMSSMLQFFLKWPNGMSRM